MSPALGSRVRPEASRQSPRRVSCIRTQTPARRQGRKAGETGCEGGKAVGRMRHWQPGPPAVEDGMDHCAHVGCARLATGFGHGHERGPDGPCHLGELGGIALPPPVPSARQVLRGPTLYHADHFADSLSDRDEPLLLLEASVVSRYPATPFPGQARGRLPYPAREAPDADEHYRNRPPPGCRSSNPRCISCNVRSDHASDGS
jgi:hypothetical protein